MKKIKTVKNENVAKTEKKAPEKKNIFSVP